MSIIRRALASERRSAFAPYRNPNAIPLNRDLLPYGTSELTQERAMQLPAVMACASLLADGVSTLPVQAFIKDGDQRIPLPDQPELLTVPCHDYSWQEWVGALMYSLLLRGNGIGYIYQRDAFGEPTGILPLDPDRLHIKRVDGELVYKLDREVLPTEDVLHLRGMRLPGMDVGLNPIAYARQGLGLAYNAEAFGAAFYANGTVVSGVIETDADLNDEQSATLARSWLGAHGGRDKAYLPAVLANGAKWKPISVNPDDAQFLETRRFQRSEIAMLFRVPPHMIGDVERSTSWGKGIESQTIGYVTHTLRPWLVRFETALSSLMPEGVMVRFNLSGLLRGDTLSRFQAYTLARNGGWMNVDEIRRLEDQPPLPDGAGEDYLQPLNMMKLGNAEGAPDDGTADH